MVVLLSNTLLDLRQPQVWAITCANNKHSVIRHTSTCMPHNILQTFSKSEQALMRSWIKSLLFGNIWWNSSLIFSLVRLNVYHEQLGLRTLAHTDTKSSAPCLLTYPPNDQASSLPPARPSFLPTIICTKRHARIDAHASRNSDRTRFPQMRSMFPLLLHPPPNGPPTPLLSWLGQRANPSFLARPLSTSATVPNSTEPKPTSKAVAIIEYMHEQKVKREGKRETKSRRRRKLQQCHDLVDVERSCALDVYPKEGKVQSSSRKVQGHRSFSSFPFKLNLTKTPSMLCWPCTLT